MQNPVGASFNFETMRMELDSFAEVVLNPVAQAKFVHTLGAGYVAGSIFMLAISSYFLLKGTHVDVMKRSFTVAASFGLAACLSVIVLGDESGYELTLNQKMKLAGIEAMWEKEPAPAGFTVFGLPNQATQSTDYQVKVPWALGLIATRSFDREIPGIKDILEETRPRIVSGIEAYRAVKVLQKDRENKSALRALEEHGDDLGYGLLLKSQGADPLKATAEQIDAANNSLVPHVAVLFWSFRFMVGIGFWLLALFAASFWSASTRRFDRPWLFRAALYSLPLPWIAIELGWIVAEYGRQPWAIEGVLPTRLGVSAASGSLVMTSLAAFVIFYTALLVVDAVLMVKYARRGPEHV